MEKNRENEAKEAKIRAKREQEKKTVTSMIEIYCHGMHKTKKGELCETCEALRAYADARTEHCPFMETKTFCSACSVHCYAGEKQKQMKEVMRYAGPRMLCVHPYLTVKHGVVTLHNKRAKKKMEKGVKNNVS